MKEKKVLIEAAQRYLRGERSITEAAAKDIANDLYSQRIFSYARRLFKRLHDENPHDDWVLRKYVISLYKDDDLSSDTKFDDAANLIHQRYGTDIHAIDNAEPLAILGSIYKQQWRHNNQFNYLKKSIVHYDRAYQLWLDAIRNSEQSKETYGDTGYSALNTAYLCDTMAKEQSSTDEKSQFFDDIAKTYRAKANEIREKIDQFCNVFSEKNAALIENSRIARDRGGSDINLAKGFGFNDLYWFYITWAEALIGLNKADEAIRFSQEAAFWSEKGGWHRDATITQLSSWAIKYADPDKPTLKEGAMNMIAILKDRMPESVGQQKIGLALSGGGFRAAIYHIGVLAKLAEMDLLRKIEVISCVSGGSIVGAYYYLKIRNLLQEKSDTHLGKDDYVTIVKELERDFLNQINIDIRSNIFSSLKDNLRMIFDSDYSRSSRLADLYEKHLYRQLLKKTEKDTYIYMQDLMIKPMGDDGQPMHINPKRENWNRANKIPILVLNATSLNTGHCWQFTASWMGEPPGYINNEIDARPTLRRMYYDEAPPPHQNIRLATAVAASSCVPGLFKPLALQNLYRAKDGTDINVELVDGGVHDNQGINTLLEQECTSLIISDASGQLTSVNEPASGTFGVTGRTNLLLQERIRDCQLQDLEARFSSGLIDGYLLMHLTKDLPSEVIDWHPCDDPYEPTTNQNNAAAGNVLTNYGIRFNVQTALANIRTDLDAFHETEANMLMYSAYKMTDYELRTGKGSHALISESEKNSITKEIWNFFNIEKEHNDPVLSEQLLKKLKLSSSMIKVTSLSRKFQIVSSIPVLILGGLLVFWSIQHKIFAPAICALTLGLLGLKALKVLRFKPLNILYLPFALIAALFLYLFGSWINVQYLKAGKVDKNPNQ